MAPTSANYEPLPQFPSDATIDVEEIKEFKDKPIFRRSRFSLHTWKPRRYIPRSCRLLYLLAFFLALLGIQIAFNSSYAERYAPPFKIDLQERVFIAANIIDGELIESAWGPRLQSLVRLIGPERVFVSIYGGPTDVLIKLGETLECDHKIVSEERDPHNVDYLPSILLPNGDRRVKRIAFLAAVRNKALEPLEELGKRGTEFGKLLFLNDVYFNPREVLRLIWGTNVNREGISKYKAACATDFVSSWKYYDTFATRDAEGYSLGIPIFPWFSSEGAAVSRRDVLAGREAVRVSSCWGGMVSFDARYFTSQNLSTTPFTNHSIHLDDDLSQKFPLRFRSEPEPFWDSSECCLVHADIMALPPFSEHSANTRSFDTGIYMNPYVRTAYSAQAFAWIPFTKRFERLFAPIQWLVNLLAGLPRFNYRRTETSGQIVEDLVWVNYNTTDTVSNQPTHTSHHDVGRLRNSWSQLGQYTHVQRVAGRGGYCGVRQLLVLKDDRFPVQENGKGGGNWENLLESVPPLDA